MNSKVLRVLISQIGVTDLILSDMDALALYTEWCRDTKSRLQGTTLDGVKFLFCGQNIAGLLILPHVQQPPIPQHRIDRPLPGSSGYHAN